LLIKRENREQKGQITPTKNRHIVDKKPYRNIIVKNKNNMNEVKF
tara:strand:+ start:808 stop:942 length:135 start_codon:yes stop_codon:yes gene_type:complete